MSCAAIDLMNTKHPGSLAGAAAALFIYRRGDTVHRRVVNAVQRTRFLTENPGVRGIWYSLMTKCTDTPFLLFTLLLVPVLKTIDLMFTVYLYSSVQGLFGRKWRPTSPQRWRLCPPYF